MTEKGHAFVVSVVLSIYIVAAVAFECTASTARISTLAIYLVFVVGLICIVFSGQFHINEHGICLLLLLVYIYSMTLINHNYLSNTVAYYYLTCTALCLIGYNLYISTNRERITTICLQAFILGSLVLAIRVIDSYGGFDSMIQFASSGSDEKERRIGGELLNENTFGLYMANAFFCCLVLFGKMKTKRPLLSIFILLISPFFAVMLLLAASKKAILFLIFGFFILALNLFRRFNGGRKLIVLVTTFIIAFIALYVISNVPAFRSVSVRFSTMFDHLADSSAGSSSDQNREYMTSRGLEAFLDSPIFGNGTAFSFTLFGTYSHNNFVELLMNYGIFGFLIYYLPYTLLFFRLLSQSRKGDLYALYFLIFVSMQIVLAIGWVNYYERITQLFTILAVGYAEEWNEERTDVNSACKYLKQSQQNKYCESMQNIKNPSYVLWK